MTPELHRPLAADRIGPAGLVVTVTATVAERDALARRLMIEAVGAVECHWALRSHPAGRVMATGTLHAVVTQACVLSLDPFEQAITERFTVCFVVGDVGEDADNPDTPDELPYDGTTIDLGEATAEQLALALDPYPRKPGAELDAVDAGPRGAFAALTRLRRPN